MAKRLLDIVFGTILSVLCLPLIILLSVGVCVSLRTWRPIFVQERIGFRGRRIRIIKLRTLPLDCPRYALKASLSGVKVHCYANFLRRTHLDELPQLLLVLVGTLSLVGPRPKMPDCFEPVDAHYREMRIQVAQGCTGLWQVGRHSAGQPDAFPEYDAFYIKHASVRLDLWIVWRTLLLVLRLAGPVELTDIPRWAQRPRLAARDTAMTLMPAVSAGE